MALPLLESVAMVDDDSGSELWYSAQDIRAGEVVRERSRFDSPEPVEDFVDAVSTTPVEIEDLPDEIILRICHYLDNKDVYALRSTSHHLHALLDGESFWRLRYLKHFASPKFGPVVSEKSVFGNTITTWKAAYDQQYVMCSLLFLSFFLSSFHRTFTLTHATDNRGNRASRTMEVQRIFQQHRESVHSIQEALNTERQRQRELFQARLAKARSRSQEQLDVNGAEAPAG